MGGLSKKAFRFSKLKSDTDLPTLIVDGGSLLFKNHRLSEKPGKQELLTANAIAEAYNLIGYEAAGVTQNDLAGGADFLLDIQEKSKFAWLSANLIAKSTGTPLFKPFISRRLAGVKVAVIGLTGQAPSVSALLGKNREVTSWRSTLPSLIEKLTADHDFIILLTDLAEGECREIAEEHPAIKLIIQAKSTEKNQPPVSLTENTILVRTGHRGKYGGVMKIDWHTGSKWRPSGKEFLAVELKEKDRLEKQLELLENRPALKSYYDVLRKRLQTLINEMEMREKNNDSADKFSTHKNHFLAMNASLPDQPEVLKLVNKTKKLIGNLNREANSPTGLSDFKSALSGQGFTGWTSCKKCHSQQVKIWQASRHSSSYLTLIEKEQQFNPDCLPCHVTGMERTDQAAAIGIADEFQSVSCESCHGPGAKHAAKPIENRTRPATAAICRSCHTPEQDDSFNFEKDVKKIKCIR